MEWLDWVILGAILLLAVTLFYLKRKANPKAGKAVEGRGSAMTAQVEAMLTKTAAPHIQPSGRVADRAETRIVESEAVSSPVDEQSRRSILEHHMDSGGFVLKLVVTDVNARGVRYKFEIWRGGRKLLTSDEDEWRRRMRTEFSECIPAFDRMLQEAALQRQRAPLPEEGAERPHLSPSCPSVGSPGHSLESIEKQIRRLVERAPLVVRSILTARMSSGAHDVGGIKRRHRLLPDIFADHYAPAFIGKDFHNTMRSHGFLTTDASRDGVSYGHWDGSEVDVFPDKSWRHTSAEGVETEGSGLDELSNHIIAIRRMKQ